MTTRTEQARGTLGDSFEIGELVAFKRVGDRTFRFGKVKNVSAKHRVTFAVEDHCPPVIVPLLDVHVVQFSDECETCDRDKMDVARAGVDRFGSKPGGLDEESIRIEETDCRLCQAEGGQS